MYCDGQPDSTRTDLKAALDYLATELPSPDMTGPCDDGYYCDQGQSHPRQYMAQPGFYAAQQTPGTLGACA